ncbi:DNA N-6-adenine-methyltransferase [Rhodopseudomonas palustris]|uniref:DNA N-6-adenine-methyltransferase n=1 Tax=Rhodopseudomonas palustris TaxID=1076 RepID=UPI0022F0E5BD|nr:DNA N-6-adenine-methyltransferase [Rhodopseudomonas palustris]WBU27515.1 DNA N-6-adenine-methyltransferase [Rhodopseudomonas palustris]
MTNAPLFAGMGGHQTPRKTRTDEWLTPPAVMNALGEFDLDPCSPIERPWPTARQHFTIRDNGLILPWWGRVWLNPPYLASVIARWLGRMAEHNRGIALIFARTETAAFHRFVWRRASALLFLRGRLDFLTVEGRPASSTSANAGAPSVLCAYGEADAEVLAFCGLQGQFVPLRISRSVVVVGLEQTWLEAVAEWMRTRRGAVELAEIYRAFANHRKAAANQNYRAKIRQVLQQGAGRRVARGRWSAP